jgi:hypothetical protein
MNNGFVWYFCLKPVSRLPSKVVTTLPPPSDVALERPENSASHSQVKEAKTSNYSFQANILLTDQDIVATASFKWQKNPAARLKSSAA